MIPRGRQLKGPQPEPARSFDSQDERDRFVEGNYNFDRGCYPSTLSYVAGELPALVRRFNAERDQAQFRGPALIAFEIAVFGSALEPAAHGMLSHAVKAAEAEGLPPQRHAQVPPRAAEEPSLAYVLRIAVVNGWVKHGSVPAHTMPRATPGNPFPKTAPTRVIAEGARFDQLKEQAASLVQEGMA